MPQWQALCISIAVEGATIFFVMMLVLRLSLRMNILGALAIAGATLMTHPLAWALNGRILTSLAFPLRASIIEVLVVFVEALILVFILPIRGHHGFVLATLANAMSFFGGLIILSAFSSH